MKIAVCGSAAKGNDEEVLKKAFEIGKEIAKNKITLVTGATVGYSLMAAKAAFSEQGEVIGFSPAKNEKEHKEKYGFKTEYFTKIDYTNAGIPRRNYDIIEHSDAVIFIGGQIGTLNEFTIAFRLDKIMGILQDSGGITEIIGKIVEICSKDNEDKSIIYIDDGKELVNKMIEKYDNKQKELKR